MLILLSTLSLCLRDNRSGDQGPCSAGESQTEEPSVPRPVAGGGGGGGEGREEEHWTGPHGQGYAGVPRLRNTVGGGHLP